MKHISISLLVVFLFVSACSAGSKTSAVFQLDQPDEVTITNPKFDLTVYQINKIDSKVLGDVTVNLKDDYINTHTIYEVRSRYTNKGDKEEKLTYKNLIFTLPDVDEPENKFSFVGFCEQEVNASPGVASKCAYVPTTKPGVYGVTGVYMMNTKIPLPGEQAELFLYLIIENKQNQAQIAFMEQSE